MEPVTHQQTNFNPYNQSTPVYSPQPQSQEPVNKKREFSLIESIFAWMSLIFGYLFCRVVPLSESPFGGLLFTLILFISGFIVLKVMKKKLTLMPLIITISGVVVSFSLILTSNNFLHFFLTFTH